jgi:hypothetical protein
MSFAWFDTLIELVSVLFRTPSAVKVEAREDRVPRGTFRASPLTRVRAAEGVFHGDLRARSRRPIGR